MDGNVSIEEKIKEISKVLEIDYDNLKPKVKSHLMNIETYLSNQEDVFNELNNSLKESKVTSISVAKAAGMKSRQTLYNNPLIKLYSEHRMEQVNSLNPSSRIDDLKIRITSLNEQVDKMVNRDIETELLVMQVELLTETIKNRESTILALEERNKAMNDKLSELKKQLPPTVDTSIPQAKIIPLNKGK